MAAEPTASRTVTGGEQPADNLHFQGAAAFSGPIIDKETEVKSYRKELWFETRTRRAFININPQVEECLRESGIKEGLIDTDLLKLVDLSSVELVDGVVSGVAEIILNLKETKPYAFKSEGVVSRGVSGKPKLKGAVSKEDYEREMKNAKSLDEIAEINKRYQHLED